MVKFSTLWESRWRIAAAAVIAAVLGYGSVRVVFGPKIEVDRVERRDIVQSVVASGRVATPYRVDVGAQIVGTVAQVPVEEGQTVKAGQTLIVLEAAEAQAGVKQAEVAVAQAEARLRQLRELQLPVADQALRQAEANFANARVQYERNKQLYESGYIGKAALDDSQRNLDVSQTQVEAARKQVETARPAGSDYAVAVTALEQARASLEAARAKLAYTTIRAPSDGTLIARDVERGDVVQPGKVLMVLAPAGETQIVLQIDERNLARLKLGQKALASADAYPAQRFPAELAYINPGVDAQRGTVEVKLRVPDPPAYLRQDMTVSADIEVDRRPGVLALRTDAVHDPAGPAPWVLKVSRGRALRQPVELGLRGESWVEVRGGLAAGDGVVPASNAAVKPGRPVRAIRHE
ncbi:MAG: efflux RND transporter periplasmic adaptor subunit [Betaproteobacteria bacterium]|nr:MAG: efflux RND transporter periplasmic adaptor subunit [Betaproteobacteria bacterium]